jgi:mannosyltransferase
MNIVFDNIIFSLQQSGGISLYWSKILAELAGRCPVWCKEQDSALNNIFRQGIALDSAKIMKEKHVGINRILPVKYHLNEKHIFHSSYYRLPYFFKNSKIIVTIHDLIPEKYNPKSLIIHQKYHSLKKADGIICVSNNTKADLLDKYPEFASKEITVIHNGVNDDFFPIDNKDHQIKSDIIIQKKPFFLFVGMRNKYKNFNFAVDFVTSFSNMNLVFVGGGALTKDEKINLIKKIPDRYTHIPFVSTSDLNILYNETEALIYPSDYEGFGIPVIEAQKSGCLYIAQNSSSIKELVHDKKLLMKELTIKNALEAYNNMKKNKSHILDMGFKNSADFSWQKATDAHNQFYRFVFDEI